jgi:type IV pilus assembly protein PilN
MKIPINLASQPFRRDRAIMVSLGAVAAVLTVSLAMLTYLAQEDRRQLAGLRHEIAALNASLRVASSGAQRLEGVLHEPQNATVLERSVFINDLIYHKSVSWSRLFADLEKTVPYNVRVMTLHPTVNSRNEVMLDMTVGAEKPEALDALLRAFEGSPIFGPVYQHSTLAPTQAEPLYRSRITVPYEQKL